MQGKKLYQEKLFMSFRLSDRVPEDNFYRRLGNTIDLSWLYKATIKYYGREGQMSIDPVVFFKLILIGYFENIGSDRRIINTVSMRMDMLFFVGYDIDEELPWHSTLSRTRQLYDKEIFKELFERVLAQCVEKGMVAGHQQAIDSVFVKANASMDSLTIKQIMLSGRTYADKLCEQGEGGQENKEDKRKLNERYRSATDPDARVSTKPGKPIALNYLAQVSVDTAGHVITNIDVHHADKNDNQCFEEVVEQTKNNLEANGLVLEEVLADTGYSSGAVLQYLDDNKIDGYIPNTSGYKAEREGFIYNSEKDEYVCSQGAVLAFTALVDGKGGRHRKVYVSKKANCSACPLRAQCIPGKADVKKLKVTEDKLLYEKMAKRLRSRKGKRMARLRGSTVEPVIGTLVNFLAMKKVNTIGIEQAGKCAVMAASAYNIKKLLKFQKSTSKTKAKVAEKPKKGFKQLFLSPYHLYRKTEKITLREFGMGKYYYPEFLRMLCNSHFRPGQLFPPLELDRIDIKILH